MTDGADHRDVLQLLSRTGRPQQKTPSAHITPSDERSGKDQSVAEDIGEYVNVLSGGDASQEDNLRSRIETRGHESRAQQEWTAKGGIARIHIDGGEGPDRVEGDVHVGGSKAGSRSDDEDAT
jgi:hypothetical protein